MKVVEILFYNSRHARLVVEMQDPERWSTGQAPHIPRVLFDMFPGLSRHHCRNGRGMTFRQESACTEIPHLFEHLVIELQGLAQGEAVLRGETHWNWKVDPRGIFYVDVEYDNEALALGAIRLAERIIRAADAGTAAEINVETEIRRLRNLAEAGAELRGLSNAVKTAHTPRSLRGKPERTAA